MASIQYGSVGNTELAASYNNIKFTTKLQNSHRSEVPDN